MLWAGCGREELYHDGTTPVLSPTYDFVATLPYLPNDRLGLGFGRSRSLSEISGDQIRRFVDTARLPASPVDEIIRETAERTIEAWQHLPHKACSQPRCERRWVAKSSALRFLSVDLAAASSPYLCSTFSINANACGSPDWPNQKKAFLRISG